MRLTEWPRMPFLSDELCGWITEHLSTLGVDELAVYAIEEGREGDSRRVLVATEVGLIDYRYGPRASTARFAANGRIYPWQAVRGVDLRVETQRLWALEHRTRWSVTVDRPRFRATTDDSALGRALADFAKVAVIMAEPSGWAPDGSEETVEPERPTALAGLAELAPDSGLPVAPEPEETTRRWS